jgi:hypothetical protein
MHGAVGARRAWWYETGVRLRRAIGMAAAAMLTAGRAGAAPPAAPIRESVTIVSVDVRGGAVSIGPPAVRPGAAPRRNPPALALADATPYALVIRDGSGRELYRAPFDVPVARTVPPDPAGVGPHAPPVPVVEPSVVLVTPVFPAGRWVEVDRGTGTSRAARRRYAAPRAHVASPAQGSPPSARGAGRRDRGTLDVTVIASGFTAAEMPQFRRVARRIARRLRSLGPFSSRRRRVRVRGYENTASLGCRAGCFDIDRLICCRDHAVVEAAAAAGHPFDEIIVVHNGPYGGAGTVDSGYGFLTNSYSTYAVTYGARTRRNLQAEVAVHEFGHSFGNLCDEYLYPTQEQRSAPFRCINCVPDCAAWGALDDVCRPGCSSRPDFRRPRDSIMLDSRRRKFNRPSIDTTGFPYGLKQRLRFFLRGSL